MSYCEGAKARNHQQNDPGRQRWQFQPAFLSAAVLAGEGTLIVAWSEYHCDSGHPVEPYLIDNPKIVEDLL